MAAVPVNMLALAVGGVTNRVFAQFHSMELNGRKPNQETAKKSKFLTSFFILLFEPVET